MNCHALHAHFENDPQLDAAVPVEMANHAAVCAECAEFVEEQIALQKSLRLVRESLVSVPESLDTRVLASFRSHSVPKPVVLFPHRTPTLRWTAAAAAALLVAAILFMTARKPAVSTVRPTPVQAPIQTTTAPATAQPMPAPVRAQATSTPKHPRRAINRPALASNQHGDPVPDRFRSLMYCDELACAAPMDVIRVQLPSDFVARPARGLGATGAVITADVLVGSDGIARGIRIVE